MNKIGMKLNVFSMWFDGQMGNFSGEMESDGLVWYTMIKFISL